MERKGIPHGSYGGWQQHQKYGIPTTPECGCEDARNGYMQQYRADNPEVIRKAMAHARHRTRALSRLAKKHKAEYDRLLAEERAKDERS